MAEKDIARLSSSEGSHDLAEAKEEVAHHYPQANSQDVALAALQCSGESWEFTDVDSKHVARKIDMYLLPLMVGTYLIQFLDKSCISYAALWGMKTDAHLVGDQYSWLSTIFYLGYLLGEFPVSVIFQKFHITRTCGALITVWGIVLLCMAAANDFPGLMATRFFLGLFECGVSPCFVILTAMFYKRDEQPFRTSIWFSMNGMAAIIGGIIAYGIGFIKSSVPSWKFPFIIFGSITIVWGVIFFLFAAPNPTTAKWLTPREKVIAAERIAENKTGMDNKEFKWYQIREAALDVKVWILALFTIASNIPNGGIVAFGPLIVNGFGFNKLDTTLLGMPQGAFQILFLWVSGYLASRFKSCRLILMILFLLIAIAGASMMYAIPTHSKIARLMGYYLVSSFSATYVLSLGLIQANIAGRTKKGFVTALLFICYCVGNVIGPQLFFTKEAPHYTSGFISMLVCLAAQILLAIALYALYLRDNKKRDAAQAGEVTTEEDLIQVGLSDLTDGENQHFRYLL